jgi:hypothetical protein
MLKQIMRYWVVATALFVLAPSFAAAEGEAMATIRMIPKDRDSIMVISIDPLFSVDEIGRAAAGDAAAVAAIQRKAMAAVDKDPTVSIWLPLYGYGTAGTFKEIRIVSEGGVSVDPEVFEHQHKEEYTGKVTIDMFTEFELWGSFEAVLYELKDPPEYIDRVTGTFHVAMPILNDPRFEAALPEDERARAGASAIWDGLAAMGEGLDALDDVDTVANLSGLTLPGGAGGGPAGGGGGGGGGSSSQANSTTDQGCVCSCAVLEALPPASLCQAECRSIGIVCASNHGILVDVSLQDLVDYMINEQGMPESMRAQMMTQWSGLTPEERKERLAALQAINPGSQP